MPSFDLLNTVLVIVCLMAFVLGFVAYLILAERKVAAWVQDRLGPNRVGPAGLLQPLADGGKMFLKEEVIPSHVDRVFFLLAPVVSIGAALMALAVVPFGSTAKPPDPVPVVSATDAPAVRTFDQQQAEYRSHFSFVLAPGLDVGVLYVFAIGSLAVYGVILAGWSANNKFALVGSLRSSAQLISYEIPLGMSVLGVVLLAGSLNLERIIAWQQAHWWFALFQPLAFMIFMTSVFAECNRLPFDLPEAEQELVGGYHTEYSSSMKLGLMLMAEYVHMVTTSFLLATLFWGGWTFFGLENITSDPLGAAIIRVVILGAKMGVFVFAYLMVRWTFPRFRFDQLMNAAWKVLLPLALLNLVCVVVVKQFEMPEIVLTGTSAVLFVGAGLVAVKLAGSVTNPRLRVRKLPPGLPEGVTYAGR